MGVISRAALWVGLILAVLGGCVAVAVMGATGDLHQGDADMGVMVRLFLGSLAVAGVGVALAVAGFVLGRRKG